jgi:hypothetical protein
MALARSRYGRSAPSRHYRRRRGGAFNLLMFVLAALGPIPMESPFLVAWIGGDAILSLAALALTERS